MRTVLALVVSLLVCLPAYAQTPIPIIGTELIAWDQRAPDLASAQAYSYSPLIDTATPPATLVPFAGVTCVGTASPFTCRVRLPALTTGVHQLRVVTYMTVGSSVLQAAPSAAVGVLMTAAPLAAERVRLESGTP